MKVLKWVLTAVVLSGSWVGAGRVEAVVDVSSTELQASAEIILPNAESFGALEGYSAFDFVRKSSVSGGITALYQARFLQDPWLESELPELQLLVYSYANQDAARETFENLQSLSSFSNGQKTILASDLHFLYYQSNNGGSGVDVFGTVDAEYRSLHLLEWNGNLILQASLFRGNGEYNQANLQAYAEGISKTTAVKSILQKVLDETSLGLGLLFPPSQAFWSSQSEKTSLDLSDSFDVPTHGTVHVDVYVSDPGAAAGTILDSSGLSTPVEGDLYLYINSEGKLFAGIYAPDFDADCNQELGWYRLESTSPLYAYEWNEIDFHFGVGGLSLSLDGVEEASCSVSQPRSSSDLYLGDFPGDSIQESMMGWVSDVRVENSLTDGGEAWDTVLANHLFLDLADTDPDLTEFEYLKDKGVFLGSDGMLYPDANLNRAEMVKVLLKTFKRTAASSDLAPFWDVPIDAWYRKYVGKAYAVGMVKGHEDGSFLPGHEINRAEFFTMLLRLDGLPKGSVENFGDVSEEDWFEDAAAYAQSKGFVLGSAFSPEKVVTRRQAARVLYILLHG